MTQFWKNVHLENHVKYSKNVSLETLVQDYIDNNSHLVRDEDFVDFEVKYDESTDKISIQMNFEEPE